MHSGEFTIGRARFRFFVGWESEEAWVLGSFFYGRGGPIDDDPWVGWCVALMYLVVGVEILSAV